MRRLFLLRWTMARRTVPIDEFLIGPLETARRDDELLVEINFPASKVHGVGSAYKKYGGTVDGLPIVGIAALIEVDEAGICSDARFSVGGILPTAQRFDGVGDALLGRPATPAAFAEAASAAADAIETQTDHLRQRPLSQGADPHARPRRIGRGPCPRDGRVTPWRRRSPSPSTARRIRGPCRSAFSSSISSATSAASPVRISVAPTKGAAAPARCRSKDALTSPA